MTHEEKINYLRIASGICGFAIQNQHLDQLISLYELILEKKEQATLDDIVDIESQVKKRADIKHKQDILDKVSTKKK